MEEWLSKKRIAKDRRQDINRNQLKLKVNDNCEKFEKSTKKN